MKKAIMDLSNVEKVGLEGIDLTSNIRSARTKHSYISLNRIPPRQKFLSEKIPFCHEVFSRGPYGKYISVKITDMVHEMELNSKTVRWITIVTDVATNIQKGAKTNIDIDTNMWCVDHKIHLIVTGSMAAKYKEKKMYICPQWKQLHKKMTGLVN